MMAADDEAVTLARASSDRGEVALRRRGTGDDFVYELIVNGAFAMDSAETLTERRLAEVAVEPAGTHRGKVGHRVLIGGLGLGYTAAEVLDHGVSGVDVVEIEECLVDWARAGLTPVLARVAADPRVRLFATDVATVLADPAEEPCGPWQAILLDVDNGPDFLIHPGNTSLYTETVLRRAVERLAPDGVLAIWCQGPSPELLTILGRVSITARERLFEVRRGQRQLSYAIYLVRRALEEWPQRE